MQLSENNHFRYLHAEDSGEFLDQQTLKTTAQDRLASFCNTMRGYEEFILNADGTIISSNLEAVNITGYEEWEVMGKHFSIFYPAEDRLLGRPQQDLKTAADHGKAFYSGAFVKKKGISFWAKVRITTFKDDSGSFTGFRVVMKDSSHNALYNYKVKRVRDEYLNLFNNSFIGIFKFRLKDHKIILLNEKARELLNLKEGEGIHFSEFFPNEQEFNAFIKNLSENKVLENCDTHVEHRGLWLSISCRVFEKQGFAEGVLADITEKKKQMAELERLNSEIDKFIYHSSHDMRAPLTTIMGLTHLVSLEKPSSSLTQYNQMIQAQVKHLDNLLKSLVNITLNKTERIHECIDFEKELEVIVREFRHTNHLIKIETNICSSHPCYSDTARIHIILKNLISNAFRFHNPHSPNPFIKINISMQTGQTIIQIEDNGIGIDESCLANIFTMFYKAERGSSGLGLYIVKSMVDKLNGTIDVISKREIGSVFTVTLPNINFVT